MCLVYVRRPDHELRDPSQITAAFHRHNHLCSCFTQQMALVFHSSYPLDAFLCPVDAWTKSVEGGGGDGCTWLHAARKHLRPSSNVELQFHAPNSMQISSNNLHWIRHTKCSTFQVGLTQRWFRNEMTETQTRFQLPVINLALQASVSFLFSSERGTHHLVEADIQPFLFFLFLAFAVILS